MTGNHRESAEWLLADTVMPCVDEPWSLGRIQLAQAYATLAVADVLGAMFADQQDKVLPALREIGNQLDTLPRDAGSIADYLGKQAGTQ